MPRAKFQTLTEQMFYILLCLQEESIGTDVMKKVKLMTNERVKVGPGTLYNLLDQFSQEDMIKETKADGRKKFYQLTEKGRKTLKREYERLQKQISDYEKIFGEEEL